ncbi:MAG: hypothetical protein ABI874_05840 [Chloroflexota bacterium]
MEALVPAIRLRMMRMRAHSVHVRALDKLHPLMTDELRAVVMHDLRLARPPGAISQRLARALRGQDHGIGAGGQQQFIMDEVAAVGIQRVDQVETATIEVPHHQVRMPTLIRMVCFRGSAQQDQWRRAATQQLGCAEDVTHHPLAQKSLMFSHSSCAARCARPQAKLAAQDMRIGEPLVAQPWLMRRKVAYGFHLGWRRRDCCATAIRLLAACALRKFYLR